MPSCDARPNSRHAIDQSEVDDLCDSGAAHCSLLRSAICRIFPQRWRDGCPHPPRSFQQSGITGNVRHDAQLDLRIIGRDDTVAGRCDKSFANTTAFGGAYRNVLQIGFVAGKPPRYGYSLSIIGMHAPGRGIHHARKLVRISGLQLGKTAIFEQDFCQRIILRKPLQHVFVGGRCAPGVFFRIGSLSWLNRIS